MLNYWNKFSKNWISSRNRGLVLHIWEERWEEQWTTSKGRYTIYLEKHVDLVLSSSFQTCCFLSFVFGVYTSSQKSIHCNQCSSSHFHPCGVMSQVHSRFQGLRWLENKKQLLVAGFTQDGCWHPFLSISVYVNLNEKYLNDPPRKKKLLGNGLWFSLAERT